MWLISLNLIDNEESKKPKAITMIISTKRYITKNIIDINDGRYKLHMKKKIITIKFIKKINKLYKVVEIMKIQFGNFIFNSKLDCFRRQLIADDDPDVKKLNTIIAVISCNA